MTNTLNIPQSAPINIKTGDWTPEWLQWITNPKFLSIDTGDALGVSSGGTGLSATPPLNSFLVGTGAGYAISSSVPAGSLPAFTGDVTKAVGSNPLILATVNTDVGSWGSGSQVATFTVNAKGLITAAANVSISSALGNFTVVSAFGCNGKPAQLSAAVNAAVSATAGGAYTATEQGMLNDLKALVNQLRLALVNNGIAV